MKRIVATLVSLVLTLGLIPGLAIAQEPGVLSAADVSASLSVQAKKKPTKAVKKKMLAAYKKVLKRAQNGGASYSGLGLGKDYAVYDMGNDGYPELFVKSSDSSWGGQFHVFDYASGKARYLGIVPLSSGWLYGTKNGKLYLSSGRQGGYSVTRVVKSSGTVVAGYDKAKTFIAKDVDDWDNAWRKCHAYVKKLKATALKIKPVTSYSLLNSKLKVS